MVWSQYVNDAIHGEPTTIESSADEDLQCIAATGELTFDEWTAWYSNDLLNMWMSLTAYREDSGSSEYILNEIDFNRFCEFCYESSSKIRSKYPS